MEHKKNPVSDEHEKRITKDTIDPPWMEELDAITNKYIEMLMDLPITKESQNWDREKFRNFLLQIGKSIIEKFPGWLDEMLKNTQNQYSPIGKFLRANRIQERLHWKWWIDMGKPYDLRKEDFDSIPLSKAAEEFSNFLTELSKTSLTKSMVAVNYVVETGASKLTRAIAENSPLSGEARAWMDAHADGDDYHSKDSREFIKSVAGNDPAVIKEIKDLTEKTYSLYYGLLKEAY